MNKTHSLNDMLKLAGLNEATSYDVSSAGSLHIVMSKYVDLISNLEFTAGKLKKNGDIASAASVYNVIGAMEEGLSSLEAAEHDLGKQYSRPGDKE